ncbi:Tubulin-tyrosine ligase family protein [Tritrichomonas foetus]|uniref:Tubulin-tyrosine ligase family protein n=1 Tax=Tritrichomonas foetus TaxID=1144522 RepID=A0A1J4KZ51_9EUKA|nr:Tubulin-tyrosine ligase family protein [Tritrichomonas foetus]|eukprot:OHT16434.1 Tubulin-tyrosine ligase family protein [Tritrichomonas foetus]
MIDEQKYLIFTAPENQSELTAKIDPEKHPKFAIGSFNTKLVSKILLYNGIEGTADDDFTLLWATSPEVDTVSPISPYQKINHFPYSKQIVGNKAELAYIIQSHPNIKEFDQFFPTSYILPDDRDALFMRMKSHPRQNFIAKPPEGSCGHGIKIVNFSDFYTIHHNAVVSEYVARPLTIDSFKFDLRIYVLVTSFAPLRAFVFREGLARFATESYNVGKENVYSQLTNATLNKHGRNWSNDFKWKLSDLLFEIEHRFKRSYDEIMNKILDTVSKTLALIQPTMAPNQRSSVINPFFELYGFDLLLDRDFNMWLIEINTNPAMGFDEEADYEVKGSLLASALSIVGIPNYTASELSSIPSVYKMTVEELEAEIIRREDQRNQKSGDNFIRIFPSEHTEYLKDLLKVVPLASQAQNEQKEKKKKNFNPRKLAQLLTVEQANEILIEYLIMTERKARKEGDEDEKARLKEFFISQGYQMKRKTTLKTILSLYIEDTRSTYTDDDSCEVPEPLRQMIFGSDHDYVYKFLSSCRYKTPKDIGLLFE